MSTLLVVHHTPSPGTRELLEAVLQGTRDPEISGVDVEVRPALAATVSDALDADGFLFGTTANFGYMSGALKHKIATYGGFIRRLLLRRFTLSPYCYKPLRSTVAIGSVPAMSSWFR